MGAPMAPRPMNATRGMPKGKEVEPARADLGKTAAIAYLSCARRHVTDRTAPQPAGLQQAFIRSVTGATGMTPRTSTRIRLELDGLVAVHAVRAVWTSLSAVPNVVAAEVTMAGATLELDGPLDRAALDSALDAAGVRVVSVTVEQRRMLPLA